MPKGVRGRALASCHPEKSLHGLGLCGTCYRKQRKRKINEQGTPKVKFRSYLKRLYNLSLDDYYKLLYNQKGVCPVCGVTPKTFYIDHDHNCCNGPKSCGKCIRGLLCQQCNSASGMLKDNFNNALKLSNYLLGSTKKITNEGHPPVAKNVICIDMDNTIYPFGDLFSFAAPLSGAVEAIQLLKTQGYKIVIFTSRLSPTWWESEGFPLEIEGVMRSYITTVLNRDKIPFDDLTSEKIPAIAYIDDKAYGFKGNWEQITNEILSK